MGRSSTSSTTEAPGAPVGVDARLGLVVVHAPGESLIGRRVVVDGELVFGRSLRLLEPHARHDKTLSREHALVTAKGRTLLVKDLGSHNGTLVNGQPVKVARVVDGDLLQMGRFLLLARPLPRASAAPPERPVLDGCSDAVVRASREVALARRHAAPLLLWGPAGVGKHHAASAALGEGSHARIDLLRPPSDWSPVAGAVLLERLDEADEATQGVLVALVREWRERAWVIALSSRDPLALEREGSLRSDLVNLFREHVVEIPPIEARREDIPFVAARALGDAQSLDAALVSALVLVEAWPGQASGLLACLRAARRATPGPLELGDVTLPLAPRPSTLAAARDGSWLQMGSRPRASLARRPVLARLFAALLAAREERPGEIVDVPTLVAATWPGDKVLPKAAVDRVYVAVSTLRKLGLGLALEHVGEGYRLDPTVDVRLEA